VASLSLHLYVKAGSKSPGFSEENGVLVLRVRERAIEGAANAACIRALADAYRVAPSAVKLVAGARCRRKRFTIQFAEDAAHRGE